MVKKNKNNKIILNEKLLNFLYNECELHEDIKDWWLKTIGNDFPINELENIDGDFKGYIKQLRDIIEKTEFDRKGNIKTYITSHGIINTYTYDKINNLIAMEDTNGYYETYETYEYDKNNNMISMQDSDGYYETYKYDKNNNMISMKNSNEVIYNYKYDNNNNMISIKNSKEYKETYEYDEHNNKIGMKNSHGYYETYEYDDDNYLISYKNSDGVDETYKYNIKNRIKIDIEFFSKGSLQDKCSIPLTYRNKNIDSSTEKTIKNKTPERLNDFISPILSF